MKMARQSMISATRPQSLCGENNAKTAILSKKPSNLKVSDFPSQIVEDVFKMLKQNKKAKYSWLQDNLGVSENTILRAINDLKKMGYINIRNTRRLKASGNC